MLKTYFAPITELALVCDECHETRGSFVATETGWLCLAHLPNIGRRANRDRSVTRGIPSDPNVLHFSLGYGFDVRYL